MEHGMEHGMENGMEQELWFPDLYRLRYLRFVSAKLSGLLVGAVGWKEQEAIHHIHVVFCFM